MLLKYLNIYPQNKGYWKFNASLLNNEHFCQGVKSTILHRKHAIGKNFKTYIKEVQEGCLSACQKVFLGSINAV